MLDLCLTGTVPDTGMDQNGPEAPADQGELFIRKGTSIIDIEFCRYAVSGDSILEYFLKVRSIVAVEELPADDNTRMGIDDQDVIHPAELPIL